MNVRDFKDRIARIMRERETGKKYSVIGGPRGADCVVRKKRVDELNSCGKVGCEFEKSK